MEAYEASVIRARERDHASTEVRDCDLNDDGEVNICFFFDPCTAGNQRGPGGRAARSTARTRRAARSAPPSSASASTTWHAAQRGQASTWSACLRCRPSTRPRAASRIRTRRAAAPVSESWCADPDTSMTCTVARRPSPSCRGRCARSPRRRPAGSSSPERRMTCASRRHVTASDGNCARHWNQKSRQFEMCMHLRAEHCSENRTPKMRRPHPPRTERSLSQPPHAVRGDRLTLSLSQLPQRLAHAGDFLDTRLTFTLGDDQFLPGRAEPARHPEPEPLLRRAGRLPAVLRQPEYPRLGP